jgi:hypothetical protein
VQQAWSDAKSATAAATSPGLAKANGVRDQT